MKAILAVALPLLIFSQNSRAAFVNAWINEFHYDNSGADVGEFIEVVVPSGFADLANLTLTLYNGNDGLAYGTHLLSSFTAGGTVAGHTIYYKAIAGIQNGNPDGFALTHMGTVMQFLSYGGAFTAVGGPAGGLNSTDIGKVEPTSTAAGSSLGLIGSGSEYSNFAWATFSDDTPGLANADQTLTAVVPEPSTWVAGALLALPFGVHGVRCLRNRKRA